MLKRADPKAEKPEKMILKKLRVNKSRRRMPRPFATRSPTRRPPRLMPRTKVKSKDKDRLRSSESRSIAEILSETLYPAPFRLSPTSRQAKTLVANRAAAKSQPGGCGEAINSTRSAPIQLARRLHRHGADNSIVCRQLSPSGWGVPVLGNTAGSSPSTSMVR